MIRVHFIFCLIAAISVLYFTTRNVYAAEKNGQACVDAGWSFSNVDIGGSVRELYWKKPSVPVVKGAIIVLHGGGGNHFEFCERGHSLIDPQVDFSEEAISRGFSVLLLQSTDIVTDSSGRLCGKVWDDEVRARDNIDLPYIQYVVKNFIPEIHRDRTNVPVFMTGISSGGYMSVRAAVEFPDLFRAVAPVSNGDPYGWHRVCVAKKMGRKNVHGAGYDNDTGKEIIERQSCANVSNYKNEIDWPAHNKENGNGDVVFKLFHHAKDGVNDITCHERVGRQLDLHGFIQEDPYLIQDNGFRRLYHHFWKRDYNRAILDFFEQHSS